MTDLMAVEPGAVLMFYAANHRGPFRDVPQVVRRVTVKRTTKTQVIIEMAGRTESEMRFRKDDGYIVGGHWGDEQLKPLTADAIRDEADSKRRRRVHRAVEVLYETHRKLDGMRIAGGAIELVEKVEPLLAAAQAQLEGVLTVIAADKEKPNGS